MKHRIFSYILLGCLPLQAQQQDIVSEKTIQIPQEESAVRESARSAARTFIPHTLELVPFTPPAPAVRERLPLVRLDAAVSQPEKNSCKLTILRGQASTAPDLPPPPPPPPYVAPPEPTPEEIARQIWQHRHNIDLGGFVFDHHTSVVHWTDPVSRVRYQAVCGFDIGLLAGIGRFVYLGENYQFFLIHTDLNTAVARRMASFCRLNFPQVAPGGIIFIQGDLNDKLATAPLAILKEVIAAEKPRLVAYQEKRKNYAAASAAWHAAHPPIPQDETFLFRPHRGSRYLVTPQPEKQEAAR